jgi:hypothetical protein
MKRKRMQELGKNRVTQIKMADICNSTVVGILAIWVVWLSSSLLIRFMQ